MLDEEMIETIKVVKGEFYYILDVLQANFVAYKLVYIGVLYETLIT